MESLALVGLVFGGPVFDFSCQYISLVWLYQALGGPVLTWRVGYMGLGKLFEGVIGATVG